MMMAVWKFAPAIAAGNTVVLKPSDTTPASHRADGRAIIGRAPARRASSTSICGDRDTGRALVEHPTPQMVSITGSVRAGMEVAGSAAKDLKRVHLELGGKAPVVVFDDADLEAGGRGHRRSPATSTPARTARRRPACWPAPGIYDDFVAALAEQAKGVDDDRTPTAPATRTRCCRPVNNANQLDAGRVASSTGCPTTRRSTPAATGVGDHGFFFEPTVVVRPAAGRRDRSRTRSSARSSPCSSSPTRPRRCAGPTASSYGLASSVWTKDYGRAMRMAKRLDFGCVWINTHIPLVAEMPHGGFKHSGYGKDLSMYGFEDYTRIKHVMANIDS